jgi:hypothetical protein
VPREVGRDLSLGGVGDVIFRTRSFLPPEDLEVGSEGNRTRDVSRMKATVDSSFPATLVADSPPRTMTLSREVVKVWPHRALGPGPIFWNENHRRATIRMKGGGRYSLL